MSTHPETDTAPARTDRPIFALFEAMAAQPAKAGTRVSAPVARVTEDFIIVSFGTAEGRVPVGEVTNVPKPGETIEVYVEEITDEGDILLSPEKAARLALHDRLEQAVAQGEQLTATVLSASRGGLAVSVLGVKAFLPQNRLAARPGRLSDWIGRDVAVKVLTLDGLKGRIEVAAIAMAEAPVEAVQAQRLTELQPGEIVEGRITRLAKFGAFVDIGGVEGLIALSELDWGRPQQARDVVQPGQVVQVKVLDIDAEKKRVGLSRKAVQPDPWLVAVERYPAGTRATGTVVGLTEFGAFVAVAPGVEGLVHLSEMAWGPQPRSPGAVVRVGASVEVEVIDVDAERRRLRLSMKRAAQNPWASVRDRFPPGTRLRGPVRTITDFGVFVAIEEGIDGLVHVSDMEWGQTVRDPASRFQKDQLLEVMVLNVEPDRQRMSLGLKQLTEDNRPALFARLQPGATMAGKVARLVDFGAFVALADGLEGLLHKSAAGASFGELTVGQDLEVTVLTVDFETGRVALGRVGGAEPAAPAEAAAEQAPSEQAADQAPAEQAPAEPAAE
jgi:small subunit ribosomal protein S1